MKEKLTQAYKQNPRRIQLQWIGRILLMLILAVLAIVMHLNITTRAAQAGVAIRVLEAERERLQHDISNNSTKLALLTSTVSMQKRAEELGFRPASSDQIEYIYLPGYIGKTSNVPVSRVSQFNSSASIIRPAYTQSIWDWLFQGTFITLDREGK